MGGKNLRFCGRQVTPDELKLIQEIVHDCKALSRTELAYTVCELLTWERPTGKLKGHECRKFLEELEAAGFVRLPGPATTGGKGGKKTRNLLEANDTTPAVFSATVPEVAPIELELVSRPEDRFQWRDWVERYHYLGCKVPFGAYLRYFVRVSRPEPRRVGCIQISSPSWSMAPRDRWIGWDNAQRIKRLQWIIQNSRFLILPWIRIPHLASSTLSRLVRKAPADWEAHYNIRPVLMETLVDTSRYRGTCYRAANWIYLGKTTGRGRMDREKKPDESKIKDIFVYPLCRKAKERLLEPPPDKSLRVQTHDLHYHQ